MSLLGSFIFFFRRREESLLGTIACRESYSFRSWHRGVLVLKIIERLFVPCIFCDQQKAGFLLVKIVQFFVPLVCATSFCWRVEEDSLLCVCIVC